MLGWCSGGGWGGGGVAGEVRTGQQVSLSKAHFVLMVIKVNKKKIKNDPI